MNVFAVWCFLLPLLVGFGIPALLAWRPDIRGLRASALYLAALLAVALLLRLVGDAPPWALASVAVFICAFALFVSGLTLIWPWPIAGQITSGLVVSAMMGSVFYFRPVIDPSLDLPALQQRIELALALNPYAIIASSIFHIDVLRLPTLYSEMADYLIDAPGWGAVAAVYALLGTGLLAGAWTRRAVAKKP
ncbi:MAG: hypothetical protein HYY16_17090 [Planctomycetes bacterium]|nr:hypothetical protein [Planctomycetota bacterium]